MKYFSMEVKPLVLYFRGRHLNISNFMSRFKEVNRFSQRQNTHVVILLNPLNSFLYVMFYYIMFNIFLKMK